MVAPSFLLVFALLGKQTKDIHGTVIVVGHSNAKLVLATESRNTANHGPVDNACKILVLDQWTVFTGSGFAKHVDSKGTHWNVYAEAAYSFEKANGDTKSTRLLNAATTFKQRIVKAVTKSLESDPDTEKLIKADENHIFSAQFLGFYNGAPEQYRIEVDYDPTSHLVSASLGKVTQTPELIIGASGRSETVNEVVSGVTPFGRSELQKWEAVKEGFPE